ncbi:hypothetical protein CNY89_16685 [Amaricoccus sp. HAR-UPW-R2A-40]|nr:hypothetical protein CNY89_16685 [Amaricoccus sp. HAR-UPW-R2A-40]
MNVVDFREARVRAESELADNLIREIGWDVGGELRRLAHFLQEPADRERIEIIAEAVEAKLGFRLKPVFCEQA